MSGGKRTARLNEQLRRELSELIQREVRDPRVGHVTITGVDVARDLGSARIFVRTTGTPEERESTLEGLDAAAPFLRTTLGKMLRVRRVPELRFRLDRSFEHAQRIERVLAEVIPDEEPDAGEGEESDGEATEAPSDLQDPPESDATE
ncbi:MAG: 30S ribosome-binding factor RbfA [Gemmatimonadota bacterium]